MNVSEDICLFIKSGRQVDKQRSIGKTTVTTEHCGLDTDIMVYHIYGEH